MKWFPSYFHVCKHYEVDYESIKRDSALNIAIVDKENDLPHRALGIPDDRAEELLKAIKKSLLASDGNPVIALEEVSRVIVKHANELAWCSMQIQKVAEINRMMGGMGGAMIIVGGPPPGM